MSKIAPAVLASFMAGAAGCSKNDVMSPPHSRSCIDYADYLHLCGGVDTPEALHGVIVAGSHAYVAEGSRGLQVIDISNPDSPALAGGVDTPGTALGSPS